MSFSSEVKEELGKRLDTARHCQIAEFAAIMAFCGKMRSDSGEEMQIEVMTENEVVLRFREIEVLLGGVAEPHPG